MKNVINKLLTPKHVPALVNNEFIWGSVEDDKSVFYYTGYSLSEKVSATSLILNSSIKVENFYVPLWAFHVSFVNEFLQRRGWEKKDTHEVCQVLKTWKLSESMEESVAHLDILYKKLLNVTKKELQRQHQPASNESLAKLVANFK